MGLGLFELCLKRLGLYRLSQRLQLLGFIEHRGPQCSCHFRAEKQEGDVEGLKWQLKEVKRGWEEDKVTNSSNTK